MNRRQLDLDPSDIAEASEHFCKEFSAGALSGAELVTQLTRLYGHVDAVGMFNDLISKGEHVYALFIEGAKVIVPSPNGGMRGVVERVYSHDVDGLPLGLIVRVGDLNLPYQPHQLKLDRA